MTSTFTFVREALANYWTIGSPIPSSAYLAKSMIEALGDISPDRPIIELGPGTGAFTRLLLDRFPENPVYGIEWNARFAALLREKYPRFRVREGCASKLCEILEEDGIQPGSVGGVLSGLPVTSLDKNLRQAILEAVQRSLAPGALYVQFTYHKFVWNRIHPPGMRRLPYRRVLRNFPPAVVLTFQKNGKGV